MRTLASQGAAPSELRALAFEEYMQAVHAFRLAFGGVPQIGDGEIAAAVKRKLGNRRYEVAKEKVAFRATPHGTELHLFSGDQISHDAQFARIGAQC